MILDHAASEIANGVVSALLIHELRERNFGVAAEYRLHQEHEIRLVSLRGWPASGIRARRGESGVSERQRGAARPVYLADGQCRAQNNQRWRKKD
jgi:hypothetical protein